LGAFSFFQGNQSYAEKFLWSVVKLAGSRLKTPVGCREDEAAMPFHPPELVYHTRYGHSQLYSAAVHLAIVCGLSFLLTASRTGKVTHDSPFIAALPPSLLHYTPPSAPKTEGTLGLPGGGGNQEALPARAGELAPFSRMPLAPPRLPHNEPIDLPAPPAVFDPNAPSDPRLVTNLGLPWMKLDTNSAGPGEGDTIGNGGRDGMGDDGEGGSGVGDTPGNYANVVSQAMCLYCPEPPYSDEARRAKRQGLVTLRVLIGSDGRTKRVRVVKSLGMGLDESAVQAIRAWRFVPARDAQKQPLAAWVTIETRFQLF
jgi:TonB family protein